MDSRLKNELMKRFELDQALSNEGLWDLIKNVYSDNSGWLKRIIEEKGWPSDESVGKSGELCAWLVVQHSPDLNFQRNCLDLLVQLPQTPERKLHIAYLTDKILVKENKPQIYGTQFSDGQPAPVENPELLDSRRESVGLESFAEYSEKMKNMFS